MSHPPHGPGANSVDPDVDLSVPAERNEIGRREWDVPAVVAVGGVLGAEARYGVGVLLPHAAGTFAWSTVVINVTGCLLLGVLMVVLLERVRVPHRLARPFLGVGILGGYTTFSTFAVDVVQLVDHRRILLAVTYLLLTVLACALAVVVGTATARRAARR